VKASSPTGGQSIPEFDYYMAPGVKKSLVQNIIDIIKIREDIEDEEVLDKLKAILMNLVKSTKSIMDSNGLLMLASALKLEGGIDDAEEIDKVIKKAIERTEKQTHQAMESLVHNLNSMHSRAGSQVPFSSINYGTDTSVEGRMVIKHILLAVEEGLGKWGNCNIPNQYIQRLKTELTIKRVTLIMICYSWRLKLVH